MIKSIYVSALNIDGLESTGANDLIVSLNGLSKESWQALKPLKIPLSIALDGFKKADCPANPEVEDELLENATQALEFNPQVIWIDHLRFGGDCTDIRDEDTNKAHQACQFCQAKDRTSTIYEILKKVKEKISGKSKLGLFTIAFRNDQAPNLTKAIGLDYVKLGQLVDMFSPMLYQQMFNQPISYISEYVQWLSLQTQKPVLPIIQIKSMPDNLEDTITKEDIKTEYQEAIKPPSLGVCFFWWNHALEKGKTQIITELFS